MDAVGPSRITGTSAAPVFALWLIPILVCLIGPPVIGFLWYRRSRFTLRHYFLGIAIACFVFWQVAPAFPILERPHSLQFILRFWFERSVVISSIAMLVSTLATYLVMRHATNDGPSRIRHASKLES